MLPPLIPVPGLLVWHTYCLQVSLDLTCASAEAAPAFPVLVRSSPVIQLVHGPRRCHGSSEFASAPAAPSSFVWPPVLQGGQLHTARHSHTNDSIYIVQGGQLLAALHAHSRHGAPGVAALADDVLQQVSGCATT